MHDIGQTSLETELEFQGELEGEAEGPFGEGPLSEEQELELASELLEVTHEQELASKASRIIRLLDGAIVEDTGATTGSSA